MEAARRQRKPKTTTAVKGKGRGYAPKKSMSFRKPAAKKSSASYAATSAMQRAFGERITAGFFDATLNHAKLLCLPGSLGNFVPLRQRTDTQLESDLSAHLLVVNYSSQGVAVWINNVSTGATTAHTFAKLNTSDILAVRPSRKTVKLSCSSPDDIRNGIVFVANIADPVQIDFSTSNWSAASIQSLIDACKYHPQGTQYTAQELSHGMSWNLYPASFSSFTQWRHFAYFALGSTIPGSQQGVAQTDFDAAPQSSVIIYIPQTVTPNSWQISVCEELQARCAANTLLGDVKHDAVAPLNAIGLEAIISAHMAQGAIGVPVRGAPHMIGAPGGNQ